MDNQNDQPHQEDDTYTSNINETPEEKTERKAISRRLLVILGLFLFLLALLAAATIMYFTSPKSSDKKSDASTSSSTDPDAAALVATVRQAVNSELSTEFPTLSIAERTGAPVYRPSDAMYAVRSNEFGKTIEIKTAPESFSETDSNKVREIVKKTLEKEVSLKQSSSSWETTYTNKKTTCSLLLESTPVSLSCADISDYTDLVKAAQPFAEAYLASSEGATYNHHGDHSKHIILSDPKITKNSAEYSNATVSMGTTDSPAGGFAGLFYAKNDKWTFWKGTQSTISCSEYNTQNLQKAFEGQACHEASAPEQMSTVKVIQ